MAVGGGDEKALGDEDRDDERVNGDDTRHDDRNEALFPQVVSNLAGCIEPENVESNTFMIRSGLKVPTPAIPMPDFAVP